MKLTDSSEKVVLMLHCGASIIRKLSLKGLKGMLTAMSNLS